MDTLQKMQLKERTCGTLLRLGWLVSVVAFVPTLANIAYYTMSVARFLYLLILILVVLATFFLILLNEGFRNAFSAESVNIMPTVQKIYAGYSVLIYVLLAVGIVLGVLTLILAIKENNGKSSRKRIISGSVMTALVIVWTIVYAATKSNVMGAVA